MLFRSRYGALKATTVAGLWSVAWAVVIGDATLIKSVTRKQCIPVTRTRLPRNTRAMRPENSSPIFCSFVSWSCGKSYSKPDSLPNTNKALDQTSFGSAVDLFDILIAHEILNFLSTNSTADPREQTTNSQTLAIRLW